MKLAVVGKGGVGKTTIAGTLARLLARDGFNVIAVDADPNLNLATSIGVPEEIASKIVPLSANIELIKSRTQTYFGGVLSYTPRVDDIVEKFGVVGPDSVKLLIMGTVRSGGSGCMCPENAFLRALLAHLILGRDDVVILDMVAGLEHLGRGTARGVDVMLCVVEPSIKAIETAYRINKLAKEIEVENFVIVANKVSSSEDLEFIKSRLENSGLKLLGTIPYDTSVIKADMLGKALIDYNPDSIALRHIIDIKNRLIKEYIELL